MRVFTEAWALALLGLRSITQKRHHCRNQLLFRAQSLFAAHGATSQDSPASLVSRRQCAAHLVVPTSNSQQQAAPNSHHDDVIPPYADIYTHPAAVAYEAAHPRRIIPKFGPYLLLQTLAEGEFGKVKLGLHSQWAQVAVKLIRRGNVDTTVRMSKVECEIEVLKVL